MSAATLKHGISLQEIDASTVRAVTELRVAPAQERYVANNAVSIAEAYFHREAWFRSIHADGVPVGFLMLRDSTLLDPAPTLAHLSLWRFMIDHRYQRTGFGRKALELVVAHARTRPGVRAIHTSYVAGTYSPADFYLSFGFRHTGETKSNGEVALVLEPMN